MNPSRLVNAKTVASHAYTHQKCGNEKQPLDKKAASIYFGVDTVNDWVYV